MKKKILITVVRFIGSFLHQGAALETWKLGSRPSADQWVTCRTNVFALLSSTWATVTA